MSRATATLEAVQYRRNHAHLCVSAQQGRVSSSRSQARATSTYTHTHKTRRDSQLSKTDATENGQTHRQPPLECVPPHINGHYYYKPSRKEIQNTHTHLEERTVEQLFPSSNNGVLILILPLQSLREALHKGGQRTACKTLSQTQQGEEDLAVASVVVFR